MSREDAVDKRKALTSGQIIAELHSAFLFYLFPTKQNRCFNKPCSMPYVTLHANWGAIYASLFPRNSAMSAYAVLCCHSTAKSPARQAGLFINGLINQPGCRSLPIGACATDTAAKIPAARCVPGYPAAGCSARCSARCSRCKNR